MEIEFEREKLFREVWASPIRTLARKYGLSDTGLRKVCVALDVPLPGRGHWAKVSASHQLVTPALPPTDGRTFFVCRLPDADEDGATAPQRDAILQEKLAFEATPENSIVVPAELVKPHRLVAAAARVIRAEVAGLQRSRDYVPPRRKPGELSMMDLEATARPNWRDYEQRGVMDLDEGVLSVRVSIEAADRALRIWDALIKACEARGMHVSAVSRLVAISDGVDYVRLRMSEKVDRITRQSARGREETLRRVPTGRLRIFLGETKFEDSSEHPLEAQLNVILASIHRSFASQRIRRAAAAARQQRKEAAAQALQQERAIAAKAARLLEEELRRQQAEQVAAAERERLLVAEANSWRDAETIRAYAAHLKAAATVDGTMIVPALRDWLTWANDVADKLDPTSKRLLGAAG